MKNFISLLFILTGYFSFCQVSGYVEYEYTKNLGTDYQTIGVLNFNNTKSYFIELSPNSIPQIDDTSDEEIVVTSFSKERPIIYIDLKKDSLYDQQSLFRKKYIIKEKIPTINWQIKNQYKTINKFKCQLATGIFRGRNYSVWFTSEIPVNFGPWKLQGLPGLIIEAIDEKKELIFSVRKIKLGLDNKIEELNSKDAIELKKYINLKETIYREKEKSMSSKMPRNSTFELNLPDRKTQKEITYEWEKTEDKKD